MSAFMNWHLRYWLARLRNEFLQLTFRRPSEEQAVEEVMSGLKRDPLLRRLLEEQEAEMARVNEGRDGRLHHMLCLVIVSGGLDGPCDCRVTKTRAPK